MERNFKKCTQFEVICFLSISLYAFHKYLSIIAQWLLHLSTALTQKDLYFSHIVYLGGIM